MAKSCSESSVKMDYEEFIATVIKSFRNLHSFEELLKKVGPESLVDVSEQPEYVLMENMNPLPPGFSQRVFHFEEKSHGRGTVDAAFQNNRLVNIRAQIFFDGLLGRSKARRYIIHTLIPMFNVFFGTPVEQDPDHAVYQSEGIIVVTRHVRGTNWVSTHLTDEKYA